MKKYRIKMWYDSEWTEVDSIDKYIEERNDQIKDDYPDFMFHQTFDVRLNCKHEETFLQDGQRKCKRCKDVLEITSYRERG